jgi:hypothetical protein
MGSCGLQCRQSASYDRREEDTAAWPGWNMVWKPRLGTYARESPLTHEI